ncbi:MAG: ATP-dependent helicase [Candidatus Altiarchaeales archaeon]|nr:MAG: ATP-dependent helicase [Candidatus Altiarchaeales archaeon]
MAVHLSYHRGSILIRGTHVPNSRWDERSKCYRALALHYPDILNYLKGTLNEYASDFIVRDGMDIEDEVLDPIPCPRFKPPGYKLRDYQRKAVDSWLKSKRGIIVLPTGSGKTLVAVNIIFELNVPSLIVVPTLDLVRQWRSVLRESFDMEIGEYSGEEKILRPVTVATYDTAYLCAEELGNKFLLLVFDEVHHLPSEGYRHIAEMFCSPYRLGLTATYERADGLHGELPRLVGGVVFEEKVSRLSGKHLAEYSLKRIYTELTDEEKIEYKKNYDYYRNYLRTHNISLRSARDFKFFIMRTGRDPEARKALLARHRARKIALNSSSKLRVLSRLLQKHSKDRVIIFTEHNDLVRMISHKFLIPSIIHTTRKEERQDVLEKFKHGIYPRIVSSKVLDEGVDVPEANIGIILSGTGSKREFIQRLGRILRKKGNKKAVLYEIVSRETTEVRSSYRRRTK